MLVARQLTHHEQIADMVEAGACEGREPRALGGSQSDDALQIHSELYLGRHLVHVLAAGSARPHGGERLGCCGHADSCRDLNRISHGAALVSMRIRDAPTAIRRSTARSRTPAAEDSGGA